MKAGKLTSENALPAEVVNYLKIKLGDESPKVAEPSPTLEPAAPQFPRPTEEQLKKMREESLQVAPELQMTPEEFAARTPADPISEADFDEPAQFDTEPSAEQMHEVSQLLRDLPQSVEELPPAKPVDVPQEEHPSERVARETRADMSEYLETVSIHTADISDIAQALYERFGVYTVYLRQLPVADEVNPLTGEAFTKYHLGIAYQASIYAQNKGILDFPADKARRVLDEGRAAAANLPLDGQPATVGENRRADTFAHRTSVGASRTVAQTRIIHKTDPDGVVRAYQEEIPQEEMGGSNAGQRYDREEDEQLVEPPIFGTRPIIRPNW